MKLMKAQEATAISKTRDDMVAEIKEILRNSCRCKNERTGLSISESDREPPALEQGRRYSRELHDGCKPPR